jgi:hypothetical protein
MSKKDKPLPKPPSRPFGRKKSFEDIEGKGSLMADQMAVAMAQGRLEEFLQRELPDNEHARKLAEMMMGMTGMMPPGDGSGKPAPRKKETSKINGPAMHEEGPSSVRPPDDVFSAVHSGDVKSLTDILKREHNKRHGIPDDEVKETKHESPSSPDQEVVEKEVIEQLIKIASDNNLNLDWIFFRALKRYVEEYKKTGNL